MFRHIILTCIAFGLSLICLGQKVSMADVTAFASNSTDDVAEGLINKGFELHAYPSGKEFRIERGVEELSIDFKDYDSYYNYKLVRLCYSPMFMKDYNSLVTQIKSQGKKISFFYSSYHIYLTEYKIGKSVYVYVGKGLCESLDHKIQYGSIIISNESIKEKLK
jgi:hypothetical protein